MKKHDLDFIDRDPWYKNHPSPFAKALYNLSALGFYWFKNKTAGLIWFMVLNPVTIVVCLSFVFAFCVADEMMEGGK